MNATVQPIETLTRNAEFLSAVKPFDVKRYTNAPLRMKGEFLFNAPAEVAFKKLTDPQQIASWFGMVKGGNVDHSQSCNVDQWGEGSKRFCETSMGKLDETIYYWKAPYITAYNVKSWSMPVKDHCGVMTIEPLNSSQCRVTWHQYFNGKGLVMRNFFPHMMRKMINDGMRSLQQQLGGVGGNMQLV